MREYYVPGLGEKDPDKLIRSLMQAHQNSATDAEDIATNAADIAAIQAAIAGPPWGTGTVTSVGSGAGLTGGPITTTGSLAVSLSSMTNSLGSNVSLNNTANYFDGPSVAQGSTGTWLATGSVTLTGTAATEIYCKLWDGTTVIASGSVPVYASNARIVCALSGILASPAGNIRISCRDSNTTTSSIEFNRTGNSKDATVTVIRIA